MNPGSEKLVELLDVQSASPARNLFGLSIQQLTEIMSGFGQPPYRARQLQEAMFRRRIRSLDLVRAFSRELREQMAKMGWFVSIPHILETFRSADGTERYLVAGDDGQTVETVWMPGGDGGEQGDGSEEEAEQRGASGAAQRATICVSSQIGCAVNCQFCLTAKLGLQRNLSAGEIAGQVIAVLERHAVDLARDRINLVFMGMGEPFLNYDEFMRAVRLLVEAASLAPSRMTVSTSGIVPGIVRFAGEAVRPKLAISLNASNDSIREEIMPVTRKWKIEDVIQAAAKIPLRSRERVTFEYVLLGEVNDGLQHADELVRLVRRAPMPVKVNLIAWNSGPGIGYSAPRETQVDAFQRRLVEKGIPTFVRRPRGRDIYAACGQLKRTLA
ncbi:MAG TPA: 23S rRNA (adenine(2503)-C(2))-methyltransferase RlmN [Acidobacteriaceae bacterium]|nr:23S rRNA (adenine(2503)-C(2))-methyltransferase RlmN [Acidobacteriaceae bacterium]